MSGHRFNLVNIGRDKFCGEATARNSGDLLRAVGRHLASRDVWITSDGTVCAGFHIVGKVEPIGDVAAAQLKAWCQS